MPKEKSMNELREDVLIAEYDIRQLHVELSYFKKLYNEERDKREKAEKALEIRAWEETMHKINRWIQKESENLNG